MKTIRELRTELSFYPHEINSQIKYFADKATVDFNVWLPTLGVNLQRGYVWDLNQKRELIWSILKNRNIPRMAMMNVLSDEHQDGVYQIIDGKQRLSSMLGFYRNEFTLLIDDKEYYFSELPSDYQNAIKGYQFPYYIANEVVKGDFTDKDKVDWFLQINFAGTAQDKEHFDKLVQE